MCCGFYILLKVFKWKQQKVCISKDINIWDKYIYMIGMNGTYGTSWLWSQGSLILLKVRGCQRGTQKRTIQRNLQHRAYKTKRNKTKTKHNMCWTPLHAKKHK
jgi:hypothetical protein